MLYTVYRTVNLTNGKYYLGVHKTENPSDSYLGSGKYIRRAVAKHGEQNFRKEVLFIYLDPESAFGKEDELIQCYRGLDPLCMNLRKGGSGGFDWINASGLNGANLAHVEKVEIRRHDTRRKKMEIDPLFKERIKQQMLEISKRAFHNPTLATAAWIGKRHSTDSKRKMSENRKNQIGERWMHKEVLVKRIPARMVTQLISEGWVFGRKL